MPTDLGPALLAIARQGIESSLGISCSPPEIPAEAHAPGAAFVTLTRAAQLRGCIGSLEAWRPLHEDVRHNAIAAAFRDPRFPPMARKNGPKSALKSRFSVPQCCCWSPMKPIYSANSARNTMD